MGEDHAGTSVQHTRARTRDRTGVGSVRVTRPWRPLVDRSHRYAVMIDGERVGRIANGGAVEIPVAAGVHTLKVASVFFVASRGCGEAGFRIRDGETMDFAARARVPVLERFPWLHPNQWIELEHT